MSSKRLVRLTVTMACACAASACGGGHGAGDAPAGAAPTTAPAAEPAPAPAPTSYIAGSGYARALQLALYFMEVQESGVRSAGNRVPWRGDAHLDDGAEWGKDLSGGWYDAGDHWKSNATMSYLSAVTGWSYLNFAPAYARSGQTAQLVNNLQHVNDYLLKTIDDPTPATLTAFGGYRIFIDVAGKATDGSEAQPNLHSVWTAPEVTDGFTVRQAVKIDTTVRGPDVAAIMAASLSGAALVLNDNGNPTKARAYLQAARKLFEFARSYPFNADSLSAAGDPLSVRADGSRIPIAYRTGNAASNQLFAAGLLYQAETTAGLGDASRAALYLTFATNLVSNPQTGGFSADWDLFGWWRDMLNGQVNHAALQLWLRLQPGNSVFSSRAPLLEAFLNNWCSPGTSTTGQHFKTPGGLAYRTVYGGSFALQWNLNNMMVAAAYGAQPGKASYYQCAKSQLDYALGSNPVGISYMVGYGNQWPRRLHHRGATGGWTGFDSITIGKPGYMDTNRLSALGAMPGGPDTAAANPDGFSDDRSHEHNEPGLLFSAGLIGTLAAITAGESAIGTPDSFLPPPDTRNTGTDWATTDREFFGEVRLGAATATSQALDLRVNNRTRWPARISSKTRLRLVFDLLPGTQPGDLTVSAVSGPPTLVLGTPTALSGGQVYVDVDFSGERLMPDYIYQAAALPGKAGLPDDLYRRSASIQLRFPAGKGVVTTTRSLGGASAAQFSIQPGIPVYDDGRLVGGAMP